MEEEARDSARSQLQKMNYWGIRRGEVAKSLFCSPNLLNYLLHFTGGCLLLVCCSQTWSWFLQSCTQESHKINHPGLQDPTRSSTGVADKRLSALAWRLSKPTLALVQGILQAQGTREAGRGQRQVLVLGTFLHPRVQRKSQFWTQVQQGLSVRRDHSLPHLRKEGRLRAGRCAPNQSAPTCSLFLLCPR